MNLANIKDMVLLNQGADIQQLIGLEAQLCCALPTAFSELLRSGNGFMLKNGVAIYSTDDLAERNETFEVAKYAPSYLVIGDDSGGRAVLVSMSQEGVFIVDHGSMDPDEMQLLSSSLSDWITSNCPI